MSWCQQHSMNAAPSSIPNTSKQNLSSQINKTFELQNNNNWPDGQKRGKHSQKKDRFTNKSCLFWLLGNLSQNY